MAEDQAQEELSGANEMEKVSDDEMESEEEAADVSRGIEDDKKDSADRARQDYMQLDVDSVVMDLMQKDIKEGAALFLETIKAINAQSENVEAERRKLWKFADVYEYHQHLNFKTGKEMRDRLQGPDEPRNIRGINELRAIRARWGVEFHVQIKTWPVPASERLCRLVSQISKSTQLSTFAHKINEIVRTRIKSLRKRGGKYEAVVMVSDLTKYMKQSKQSTSKPVNKRKQSEMSGGSDKIAEDVGKIITQSRKKRNASKTSKKKTAAAGGRAGASSDKSTSPNLRIGDNTEEEVTEEEKAEGKCKATVASVTAKADVAEPETPEVGRSNSFVGGFDGHSAIISESDDSPASQILSDAKSSPSRYYQAPSAEPEPVTISLAYEGLNVDLPEDLCHAITNLSSNGMLCDEAVNNCLEWEAAEAENPDYILFNSFFFMPEQANDIASKDNKLQKRYQPAIKDPSGVKFIAPVHLKSEIHWVLVVIDFDENNIDYYDSMQNEATFDLVTKYVTNWMVRTKESLQSEKINRNAIECAQQPDGISCGDFVLLSAAQLLRNRSPSLTIHTELIHSLRAGYCKKLYQSVHGISSVRRWKTSQAGRGMFYRDRSYLPTPRGTNSSIATQKRTESPTPSSFSAGIPTNIPPQIPTHRPSLVPIQAAADIDDALQETITTHMVLSSTITLVEEFYNQKMQACTNAKNGWQAMVTDAASQASELIEDEYMTQQTKRIDEALEAFHVCIAEKLVAEDGLRAYKAQLSKYEKLREALQACVDEKKKGKEATRSLEEMMAAGTG